MNAKSDSFESLAFFRGFGSRYRTDTISINVPRRDRRPKDSSMQFQEVADSWFVEKFGLPFRSGAVFLTSRIATATAHAHGKAFERVMRVVPLSPYSYCWSPEVSDLLFIARECQGASADAIKARLSKLKYRTDSLLAAHESGHEVMLYCDVYASIPLPLLPDKENKDVSRILMP